MNYQLNLKEGDLIQITITSVGHSGIEADTSKWANIESVEFVTLETDPSPGSEIYANVTNLKSDTAELTQERGIYNRNHLPNDSIRVVAVENISTNMCKAITDNFRNLESIYVVGVTLGTDATVQLQKIRDGTAIAFPTEIHRTGIKSGQPVTLKTTVGIQRSVLIDFDGDYNSDIVSKLDIQTKLSAPACATGIAQANITDLNGSTAVVEVESYSVDLPTPNQTIEVPVREGQSSTTVPIENSDVEILVEFDQTVPITGTGLAKLDSRKEGVYQTALYEYTNPPVSPGERFTGLIYASQNKGRIQYDDTEFYVTLMNDISNSGNATMEIKNISDRIEAKIIGDIEPISTDDTESTNIDMTNLSKL